MTATFSARPSASGAAAPRARSRWPTKSSRNDTTEQTLDNFCHEPLDNSKEITLRTELEHITNSTDAHRKAAVQAFVHRLVVVEPGVIQRTYLTRGGIPANPAENPSQAAPTSGSRAVTKMVGCKHSYSNLPDLCRRLVSLFSASNARGQRGSVA